MKREDEGGADDVVVYDTSYSLTDDEDASEPRKVAPFGRPTATHWWRCGLTGYQCFVLFASWLGR